MPKPPPKVDLILAPTPLHRLDRVSQDLGLDLWIKRDDLSGFALGGNKGRKLEYLMADAIAQQAQVVVSCGSAQSNFIRQLGAACTRFGMTCAAAVMDLPYEGEPAAGEHLEPLGGNVLLDEILGVDLRFHPDAPWEELYAHAEELAQEHERAGLRVYRIPVGGSSPLGAYAFYQAAQEVNAGPFDLVVTSSSSGSTHTGLAYGFAGTHTRVLGISADPEPGLTSEFALIAQGLDDLAGRGVRLRPDDFELSLDYVGPGYGLTSAAADDAARYLARREGIFLDPIYSGKAFAGLLDLARKGELSGRVLFWHTGGVPSLFARRIST